MLSDDLKDDVESILIDDERNHVLTNIRKTKTGVKKTESDHNTIFTKLKLSWNKIFKERRIEMFNLKNKACQEVFKDATTAANNNKYLSSVFYEEGDVNKLTEKFLRRLNKTINKCFRKIRIKDQEKVDNVKEDLFNKWRELKKKGDAKSIAELEEVENELAEKYAKENYDKIK